MESHRTSKMKSPKIKVLLILAFSLALLKAYGQCPSIPSNTQEFCDLDSLLISDLIATDEGAGVAWFSAPTGGTPLNPSGSLVDGQTYYVDNAAGNCGNRQPVFVNILGPPTGPNFQGVCVENASLATIQDLIAFGNDIQWYTASVGGSPLAPTTVLVDETIYYADQSSPLTGCRTSRLAVLVNVGIVTIPTGEPFQEFCLIPGNPPTIDDLVVNGDSNWYLSAFSGSPLDPTTELVDGQTYYAASVDPPCESSSRFAVSVTLIQQDDAGTDGTLEICQGDTNTFDLFNSLGGTPDAGGSWSPALASGSGLFDPAIDPAGVYTYTVAATNPVCPDATATVTVTIETPPSAGTDGTLEICQGDTNTFDLFNSLGGTPDAGGSWSPALASGSGLFDPAIDPAGVYTYTVAATNPVCPDATATVTVTIETPPSAGTDGTLEICQGDTNTFDLFNSLGGTPDAGGSWSPALASGSGLFDPAIDPAGVYTYTVAATNPVCPDATAIVTVTIETPPSAGTDGTLEICQGDTNTFDLFNSLGGTPDAGGSWSPALASGSGLFDPAIDPAGVYTYTVAATNPVCPDATATVTVTIETPPSAGTDGTLEICQGDTNTFDLFNSLGGTPDAGGSWSPALASGSGLFDPAIDPAGVYTYTVAATNPVCPDATATVTVTIETPPSAGTDGTLEICQGDTNTFDLFNSLGGTPDAGGSWSPALASGSGLFDPAIDPAGVYTYTVAATNPVCPDATAIVTVTIETPPSAGTDGTLEICQGDTNTFDLFNSLGGTPDAGGSWSPALASGSGLFDPAIDPAGVYTYTVAATNPVCPDATAIVTVTIETPPSAGTDGTLEICQGDTNTFDLFNSLGGTPDAGGSWSPALASGSGLFDPAIDPAGVYTYTVAATNPVCPDATATVTVTIETPPSAGTDGTLEICQGDTNTFDLFNSLGGTPDAGGSWSPALASGSGLFDPAIDPAGVYTYTVAATNPVCPDATATVTVTIETPPSAGTDGTLEICQGDTNTFDLFNSLGGTPDAGGSWSPALASGSGLFDPAIDPAGVYTYTVAATNPVCPDATATVTVTIETPPSAGTDGTLEICQGDTNTFDLFNSLGGTPDAGGSWSPALASGSGLFDPAIDPAGVYTYTVAATNPVCPDATAIVTVTIETPPSAGTDGTLEICQGDTNTFDLFNSLGGTPDAGGSWSPALASGSGLFDPAIDPAGVYTYTVDQPQCGLTSSSEVTVQFVDLPDITGITILITNTCAGQSLDIELSNMANLEDGNYNISYTITGPNSFSDTADISLTAGQGTLTVPFGILLLNGTHEFIITDFISTSTNCPADTSSIDPVSFEILESITPELIENGNQFCLGDDATVNSLTDNISTSGEIEWYTTPFDGTPINPDEALVDGNTYYASTTSSDGCPSTIRLEVTVSIEACEEDLLIPDGFSPNGDSINDTFHINNLAELYPNFKLTIYNRYGKHTL
jgi:hypothetical protein